MSYHRKVLYRPLTFQYSIAVFEIQVIVYRNKNLPETNNFKLKSSLKFFKAVF